MSDKWNNEVNSNIVKVTPPSLYVPRSGIKIFLAGSIDGGEAPNWQNDVANYIEKNWLELDITVYNPRWEGDFNPEMETEHATWTMSMLTMADFILLHLTGESGSPISTLELGMFIKDPRLFVSISDEYVKKEVVEYHYNCFGIREVYENPNSCIDAMKAQWYRRNMI